MDVVTPISRGTASRLGLRKPQPPLVVEISLDLAAFNRSMEGLRAFMVHNDALCLAALANLNTRLRSMA